VECETRAKIITATIYKMHKGGDGRLRIHQLLCVRCGRRVCSKWRADEIVVNGEEKCFVPAVGFIFNLCAKVRTLVFSCTNDWQARCADFSPALLVYL
jgi:hypothetical protein